jgi:putative ABC transport system permease protein
MWNEVRLVLRSLAKTRGFTIAAVTVIALCVGANAAVFSVVYGVLWKPLRFPEPNRFVEALDFAHGEGAKQIADRIVGGKTIHAQQRL